MRSFTAAGNQPFFNSFYQARNLILLFFILLSGSVYAQPTTQAHSIKLLPVSGQNTQMTFTWTSGTGTNNVLIVLSDTTSTFSPTTLTSYNGNVTTNFGAVGDGTANDIGTGSGAKSVAIYNGLSSVQTVTVSGLTAANRYFIQIFEYTGTAASGDNDELYNTSSALASSAGANTDNPLRFRYFTSTPTGKWFAPTGVSSIRVQAWGGGGAGAGRSNVTNGSGGGGGGAYSETAALAVTSGTGYSVVVGAQKAGTTGAAGAGNPSSFGTTLVVAAAGSGGTSGGGSVGAGGAGGVAAGSIIHDGGDGGKGEAGASPNGSGGPGGSSGGTTAVGVGDNALTWSTATASSSNPAGSGKGGNGGAPDANGLIGEFPGGGGGGAGVDVGNNGSTTGGSGASGLVIVSYSPPTGPDFVSAKTSTTTNIQVKFNSTITSVAQANGSGFTITGATITAAAIDGTDATIVNLTVNTIGGNFSCASCLTIAASAVSSAGGPSAVINTKNVTDGIGSAPFTVGSLTPTGGTIQAGIWNSSNTGLNVVIPLSTTDVTLDNGSVQLQVQNTTNTGFVNIPTSGLSTITNGERTGGTKTISVTAANLEAAFSGLTGFQEGKTIEITAIITDANANTTTGTKSATTILVDQVSPTAFTVGAITTTGGTVVAGNWNASNTGLDVTIPLSTADASLDGGAVQVKVQNTTNTGYVTIGTSGASIITNGERVAGSKTISITAADLEAAFITTTGFQEAKTLEFIVDVTDIHANPTTTGTKSVTTIYVDQTAPAAFNTGAYSATGGTVVAGKWNSTNTGITVAVPIANEASLSGGTVQLQGRVSSGSFANLGTPTSIAGGDLGTNKNVTLTAVQYEAITSFADGQVIEILAIISDASGNPTTGAASASTLTVDQSLPAVGTPDLASGFDTGSSNSDDYTNLTTVDFSGTSEANASIVINDGSTQIATTTATGGGTWSVTGAIMLGTGARSITAVATDAAGNPNTSSALIVTVDQTNPTAFTVGTVASTGGTTVAGYWNASNTSINIDVPIANDASLVSGTIQLQMKNSGDSYTDLGTAISIPSANTTQTVNITAAVLEAHASFTEPEVLSFRAIITDKANNPTTGTVSATTITVDQTAPSAFTTGASVATGGTVVATYWNSTNTGVTVTVPIANEATLNGGNIQLQGRVQSGSFANIGGTTAIGGGDLGTNKNVALTAVQFEGIIGFANTEIAEIRAIITDGAGNPTTGGTSANTFTIDQVLPASGTPDLASGSDSGSSNTDDYTKNTTVDFSGTSEANASIIVRDGSTQIGSTTATAGGAWSVTNVILLGTGARSVTAIATDAAGNPATSSILTVTVDQTAPAAFTTGSVASVGGTVVAGYWNSTNTSITINVPIANDASLAGTPGGSIQLQMRKSTDPDANFTDLGSAVNIPTANVTQGVSISAAVLEAHGAFAETNTLVFRAIITDKAANPSTTGANSASTIVVDQTLPTLTAATIDLRGNGKPDRIYLTFNEALAFADNATAISGLATSDPTLNTKTYETTGYTDVNATGVIPSMPFIWLESTGNQDWSASTTVTYTSPVSNKILDVAGNEIANFNSSIIDGTAPYLVTGMVFNPNGTGQETITFNLSETLTLADGSQVTGFTVYEPTTNTTYTIDNITGGSGFYTSKAVNETITLTSVSDGLWTDAAQVSYIQASGNIQDPSNNKLANITNEQILLKNIHIVSNNANFPATLAKPGDIITLTFFSTRPLSPNPTVLIDGQAAAFVSNVASSYTYTYTTSGTNNTGALSISITAPETGPTRSTLATVTTDGSSITFDKTVPTITPVSIASNNFLTNFAGPGGQTITVSFTSNETINLATGSNITTGKIGGASPPTDGLIATISNAGGLNYTAWILTDGTNIPNGTVLFSITAKDNAGNATTFTAITTGTNVTFDKTAPTASSINIASAVLLFGSNGTTATTVDYTVTFSELVQVSSVTADDFTLTGIAATVPAQNPTGLPADALTTGTVSAITAVAPSGGLATAYTVTVNSITGKGFLRLDLNPANTLIDRGSNDNTAARLGDQTYSIVYPEPTNHVTGFTASSPTSNSLTLSWANPVGPVQAATHYLILAKEAAASYPAVADGTYVVDDTDFSDGVGALNVLNAPTTTAAFTTLNSGTTYSFLIYPYSLSGKNSSNNINFRTAATVPTASNTTGTGSANNITAGTTNSPATISSITGTSLTKVLTFKLKDDGTNNATDNAKTYINQIVIKGGGSNTVTNWSDVIASADLKDITENNTVTVTNAAVGTNTITFPLVFSNDKEGELDDNEQKEYELRIALKSTMTNGANATIDNLSFDFLVDDNSFTGAYQAGSSTFGAGTSRSSSTTGANTVIVNATKLTFTTAPPSTALVLANLTTTPVVTAQDANANTDKDYTSSLTISNSGSLTMSQSSLTGSSGVYIFPASFQYTHGASGSATNNGNLTVSGPDGAVAGVASNPAVSGNIGVNYTNTATITFGSSPLLVPSTFTGTGATAALSVFDFTVTDDNGVVANTDGAPLRINTIVIGQGGSNTVTTWTDAISEAWLVNGTSSVQGTVGASTITFSNLATTSASSEFGYIDDFNGLALGSETFVLKINLKAPMTGNQDNKRFHFIVDQGTANKLTIQTSGAPLQSSYIGNSQTANSGSGNDLIDVDITHLAFTQDFVGNSGVILTEKNISNQQSVPVIKALDAAGNIDLDYANNLNLSSAVSNTLASIASDNAAPNAGVYTFPNSFQFTNTSVTPGTTSVFASSTGGGPNYNVTSSLFTVRGGISAVSTGGTGSGNVSSIIDLTHSPATGATVFAFNIRDEGNNSSAGEGDNANTSITENDGSPTRVTQIIVSAGGANTVTDWSQVIAQATLTDDELGTPLTGSVGVNTITFASMNTGVNQIGEIDDGAVKNYTLKIWMKTSMTSTFSTTIDGLAFSFRVKSSDITTLALGSGTSSTFRAGGSATTTNASSNTITVVATSLDYTNIAVGTTTSIGQDFLPGGGGTLPVLVEARDVNGNRDLSYAGTVSFPNPVSGNGNTHDFLVQNLPSGSFSLGLKSYPTNFQFLSGNDTTKLRITGSASNGTGIIAGKSVAIDVKTSYESTIESQYINSTNTIPYISYVSGDITGGNAYLLDYLHLFDGGTDKADNDGSNTVLKDITFGISNYQVISKIALYVDVPGGSGQQEVMELDSTNFVATAAAGYQQITFSNINLLTNKIIAQDQATGGAGYTKIYLYATFKHRPSVIIDNQLLQVSVLSATLATGSQFAPDATTPGYIGGIASSSVPYPLAASILNRGTIGATNYIAVVAKNLDFVVQPSSIAGKKEPITGAVGTSPGGSTGIVHARDRYGVVDLDFNYSAVFPTRYLATITAPAGLATYPNQFINGVLDLTGMRYDSAGVGTLKVKAFDGTFTLDSDAPLDLGPPDSHKASSQVDVIHVSAIDNQETANGFYDQPSLRGGEVNKIIFGVEFIPEHKTASLPNLKSFTVTFRNKDNEPYDYASVYQNIRLLTSNGSSITTALQENVEFTAIPGMSDLSSNSLTPVNDQITFDFASVANDIPLNDVNGNTKFYIQVDINVNANISTREIIPYLVDLGYFKETANANWQYTNGNILTDKGSSTAFVKGMERTFASTSEPELLVSYPPSGRLNVELGLDSIVLDFNVDVVSFDGKVFLHNSTTGAVTEFTAKPGKGLYDPNNSNLTNQVGDTLVFFPPLGFTLDKNTVYYVTIDKGVFSFIDPAKRKGIADQGFNLYGGIEFNNEFYFKSSIEDIATPELSGTDPTRYYVTPSAATINFKLDKPGKLYYLVATGAPATLTNAHIFGTTALPSGTAIYRDSVVIDQYSPNYLYVTIDTALALNTTYSVYAFSANDAYPNPFKTAQPYGAYNSSLKLHPIGTVGPTFTFTTPATYPNQLNNPKMDMCFGSSVKMEEPIIISEGLTAGGAQIKDDFSKTMAVTDAANYTQTFYMLLPSGFVYDVSKKPVVTFHGSDFDPLGSGEDTVKFINSTILAVSFKNSTSVSFDNIVISDLYIIASAKGLSGNITRFSGYGLKTINDGRSFARLSSSDPTKISFTNSYDEANKPWPYTQIATANPYKPVSYIPDSYPTVQLIPQPGANDYGLTTFSGVGVNGDLLTTSAVAKDASFKITVTHTDQNGCTSTNGIQYLIYQDSTAIAELLKPYVSNYRINGTKVGLIPGPVDQFNVPTAPSLTQNLADSVSWLGTAGYRLIQLYADIPVRAGSTTQYMSYSLGTTGWQDIVRNNIVKPATGAIGGQSHPFPNLNQTYQTFNWEYSDLINKSVIESKSLVYPYDPINSPFSKQTPVNRLQYFDAASLGIFEFTGLYQSTADYSVFVPFRQEIEVFIPSVPAIELSYESDRRGVTSIYCGNGVPIDVSGYPLANSTIVKGFFALKDSATAKITSGVITSRTNTTKLRGFGTKFSTELTVNDTIYYDSKNILGKVASITSDSVLTLVANATTTLSKEPYNVNLIVDAGFVDRLNGTATFDPKKYKLKNNYSTIRMEYTYKQVSSPAVGTGVRYIRVTPNPNADFKYYSDTTVAQSLKDGRPVSDTAYCVNNWIYFENASTFSKLSSKPSTPATVYAAKTNPVWDLGTQVGSRRDTTLEKTRPVSYLATLADSVYFRYPASSQYDVSFTVNSQFNCPSNVAQHPIFVGAIPTPKFSMLGLSVATDLTVTDLSTVTDGLNTDSQVQPAKWYFGDGKDTLSVNLSANNAAAINSYQKLLNEFDTYYYANPANWIKSVFKTAVAGKASHDFTRAGHFDVSILSTTKVNGLPGCAVLDSRHIVMLPVVSKLNANYPYEENFEYTSGNWQITRDSANLSYPAVNAINSWGWGQVSRASAVITNKAGTVNLVNGDPTGPGNFWVTGKDQLTQPNERSFLYAPAIHLDSITRPMVSFHSAFNFDGNDGVVLQYSLDTLNVADPLKKWTGIGEYDAVLNAGTGQGWYNAQGIASSPGNGVFNNGYHLLDDQKYFGWSGTSLDWQQSKHTLLNFLAGKKLVVFRFAFAANDGGVNEGFALDNFRIGERTRTVLFENFSNLGNAATAEMNGVTSTEAAEMVQSDTLNSAFYDAGINIVKLNYHTGFPQKDPFNLDNGADPSARALYYSVSTTPYAIMDGAKYQSPYVAEWGAREYSLRSLELARAEFLNVSASTFNNEYYKLDFEIKAIENLSANTILHVALAEVSVTKDEATTKHPDDDNDPNTTLIKTGETDFKYIVKKMIPSATGTRFGTQLNKGDTLKPLSFKYTPDLALHYDGTTNDIVAVIFLQDETTKVVHQAMMVGPFLDPTAVTGDLNNPFGPEDVSIYPNPADNQLNVVFPSRVQVDVPIMMFDQMGRITHNTRARKGDQSATLETGRVASGVYILQLDLGGGKVSRTKVIVNHGD